MYQKAKDIFTQRRTPTNEGFEEYPLIVQPLSVLTTDGLNNLTFTLLNELSVQSASFASSALTASFALNVTQNDSSSWASASSATPPHCGVDYLGLDGRATDMSEPDPTADENLERLHGRGILLIESYMDEVEWLDGGRRLKMVKWNPAGEAR